MEPDPVAHALGRVVERCAGSVLAYHHHFGKPLQA
jgi:hypothetical protein